jgi:hypothetical protein
VDQFPSGADIFLFATEPSILAMSKQLLNQLILQLATHLYLMQEVMSKPYRHSSRGA